MSKKSNTKSIKNPADQVEVEVNLTVEVQLSKIVKMTRGRFEKLEEQIYGDDQDEEDDAKSILLGMLDLKEDWQEDEVKDAQIELAASGKEDVG